MTYEDGTIYEGEFQNEDSWGYGNVFLLMVMFMKEVG